MNIVVLSMWVCVLAVGVDSNTEVEKPLIAWRFDVFLLKDDEAGSSGSAVGTNNSNSTLSLEPVKPESAPALVPPTSPIDSTPPFFSVFDDANTIDIANVTLVEDGQIVDVDGTRIRIRADGQFEIKGNSEGPLEESNLVYDMETARLLVTSCGEKAENYSQRMIRRLSKLQVGNVPFDAPDSTWQD